MKTNEEKGFALVGAIVLALCLVILTTALVLWVQQESRVAVKHGKSTRAFHLAEAAIDRGRWKLQESNAQWTSSGLGTVIMGYNFDKAHKDITGGQYAIKITSHPSNADQRIIEGTGRDDSTMEVRTLYAVAERQTLDAAIWSGGEVELKKNSEVHWGPVKSQTDIELEASQAAARFPRMYSRGKIELIDANPAPPNTDNKQYWAYFDVPPRPIIDFNALKSSAQSNGTYFPEGDTWQDAYPGSPNFDCDKPPCKGNEAVFLPKIDDNLIWYFDGDFKLKKGTFLQGVVIVMGEFKIEGDLECKGYYSVTPPPANAWMEYKNLNGTGDTSAANEWYADAGGGPPSAVSPTFTFMSAGSPAKKDGIAKGVCFKGFVYAQEEFEIKKETIVHGMIIVEKDEVENSKSTIVFYDPGSATNVAISKTTVSIVEWQEQPGSWPGGL
ncbi:MAG: hypothetical protein COV48_02955 [Elusimicrobia bacterium CG11_big_fil_rev_8_21_14_0_20_64_6]|nr:MAG: hypothetical protein COV48_02955 [Elusimicrobia bacterium CG11_big_fil_rev_8_21_14_0_20_64_6]